MIARGSRASPPAVAGGVGPPGPGSAGATSSVPQSTPPAGDAHVISGGPGTGKTALIGGIVRALDGGRNRTRPDRDRRADGQGREPHRRAARRRRRAGARDAAPSARAQRRPPPGRGAGDFRHHENHPLPHAAVIVDEASMVGLR